MFVLRKRLDSRLYAADSGAEGASGADTLVGAQTTEIPAQGEQRQREHMIPKSRFDDVNEKYREAQAQLETMQVEKQESEVRAKEEAGKFKTLYESTSQEFADFKKQFENVEAQKQELEGAIGELLAAKMKSVPEEYHDLIPETLTATQKLLWVDRAEQRGVFGTHAIHEPLGGATNPATKAKVDITTLSASQKLSMGYSTTK